MGDATRYMGDARLELLQAERALASNRKTERHNPNPKSVAIAEATYPSLLRKRDALLAEIAAGLPDRPSNPYGTPQDWKGTTPPAWPASAHGSGRTLSPEELRALDIPAFLRR